MSREMTNAEAIANLNHIYGIVSPDIQRSLDLAIKALEEQSQGEWVENVQSCKCSKCDGYALYWKDNPVLSNFCPNCGAQMEVKKNDD